MIFSGLGGLISPLLGNSLAQVSLSSPFVFWAVLATMAFLGFRFVKWPLPEPVRQMAR